MNGTVVTTTATGSNGRGLHFPLCWAWYVCVGEEESTWIPWQCERLTTALSLDQDPGDGIIMNACDNKILVVLKPVEDDDGIISSITTMVQSLLKKGQLGQRTKGCIIRTGEASWQNAGCQCHHERKWRLRVFPRLARRVRCYQGNKPSMAYPLNISKYDASSDAGNSADPLLDKIVDDNILGFKRYQRQLFWQQQRCHHGSGEGWWKNHVPHVPIHLQGLEGT